MVGSEWRRGWISEIITKVSLSHNFLIACSPPPAESGLFIASGQVGADGPTTIHQISEFRLFSDHSRGNSLEGQGSSLLQGLRFRRQKRLSELRKAKNLGQGAYPVHWTAEECVMLQGRLFRLSRCPVWASGGRKKTGRDLTKAWMPEGFWGSCTELLGWALQGWVLQSRADLYLHLPGGEGGGSRAKFSSIIEKYNKQFHFYTWAGDCENSYSLKQEVLIQFSRDSRKCCNPTDGEPLNMPAHRKTSNFWV